MHLQGKARQRHKQIDLRESCRGIYEVSAIHAVRALSSMFGYYRRLFFWCPLGFVVGGSRRPELTEPTESAVVRPLASCAVDASSDIRGF